MKAITLWQPHASLLVVTPPERSAPWKRYETRSWAPPQRLIGQRIAIHAGLNRTDLTFLTDLLRMEQRTECEDMMLAAIASLGYRDPLTMPVGAVIGTAVLVGARRTHQLGGDDCFGDFSAGRWAWEFAEHQVFDSPIPAKGKQGIWDWGV